MDHAWSQTASTYFPAYVVLIDNIVDDVSCLVTDSFNILFWTQLNLANWRMGFVDKGTYSIRGNELLATDH